MESTCALNGKNGQSEDGAPVGSAANQLRIRDRIKELRRVKASELLPNPKNWRRHPKVQRAF